MENIITNKNTSLIKPLEFLNFIFIYNLELNYQYFSILILIMNFFYEKKNIPYN